MPREARKFASSGYYHVVARGIGHQILFEQEEDYLQILKTIEKCKTEERFEVIAYCLMENHIHLLLCAERGLSNIMKRIFTSYATYYNKKYERVGHLFQNRFMSEPIENEAYLFTVIRYIHNNPPKAGICPREQYRWSSWREYMSVGDLVSTKKVLDMFGGKEAFIQYSKAKDETECLEISKPRLLSDQSAREMIIQMLDLEAYRIRDGECMKGEDETERTSNDSGGGIVTRMRGLGRKDRDHMIKRFKEEGLSVRQIERLTGISRGVIQRL